MFKIMQLACCIVFNMCIAESSQDHNLDNSAQKEYRAFGKNPAFPQVEESEKSEQTCTPVASEKQCNKKRSQEDCKNTCGCVFISTSDGGGVCMSQVTVKSPAGMQGLANFLCKDQPKEKCLSMEMSISTKDKVDTLPICQTHADRCLAKDFSKIPQ